MARGRSRRGHQRVREDLLGVGEDLGTAMDGGEVGVGDLAKEAFEGRHAEGDTGGVEDRGIQLFEIIAGPFFPAAPLPFGFDEPEAFLDM